jgi:hypothetical protein
VGQQPASCPTATQFVDNLPPGQISSKIGFTGTWTTAAAAKPWGVNASLVSNTGPNMSYTWKPGVFSTTLACKYQVWVWWTSATNRTNKATYTVLNTTAGNIAKTFNQQTGGGKWQLHGTYTFPANVQPKVRIANLNGGRIAADAVKFVFQP